MPKARPRWIIMANIANLDSTALTHPATSQKTSDIPCVKCSVFSLLSSIFCKTNPISKIPIPSGDTLLQLTRCRSERVYPQGATRVDGSPLQLCATTRTQYCHFAQNKPNLSNGQNDANAFINRYYHKATRL